MVEGWEVLDLKLNVLRSNVEFFGLQDTFL